MCEYDYSANLLCWYDNNARTLPWRIAPNSVSALHPDPYRIWLSEIMLQQTTVVTVKDYFNRFIERWPTVHELAAAKDSDVMAQWAGLGYYARARNLLKCARIIAHDHGGQFPNSHAALLKLPGIGPYTAAAISAIAFDQPQTVVDGNVERVMARVFAIQETLDIAKPEIYSKAAILTPPIRPGDHAQAVMDLGATICTPKSPKCENCPWALHCKSKQLGIAQDLPRKRAKPAKPTRIGYIYVARRTDGAWLLERRPQKGLLGGMLGWPGSDWCAKLRDTPPISADWTLANSEIKHTFTHFHLRLTLCTSTVEMDVTAQIGTFVPTTDFNRTDLPTVMRKAYDAARPIFRLD